MFPFSAWLDLVYPRSCAACGGRPADAGHLCWDCFGSFEPVTAPFCTRCGDPVEGRVDHDFVCSACRFSSPGFDRARSALRYRGALKGVLQAFKYRRASYLSGDLVPILKAVVVTYFGGVRLDGVTFVPLHARRERERTYNQARLLASGLAAALGVPFAGACLKRVRWTATQTDLKAPARRRNVQGAFEARRAEWLRGRNLLLVDDVMTTGATARECACVLRGQGAAGVYVATVARG